MGRIWLIFGLLWLLDIAFLSGVYFALPDTTALLRKTPTPVVTQCNIRPKPVPLKETSEILYRALLVLEDSRFYEHNGFDLFEMSRAIRDAAFKGKRLRGASTITQQLAKNLYLSPERTFKRKLHEALIATKMELTLPKWRIIELYLNIIDWGKCLVGIRSASEHYFQKHPRDLTIKESIFLAAIVPNPARFSEMTDEEMPKDFVRSQMIRALDILYKNGRIDINDYQRALLEPIDFEF